MAVYLSPLRYPGSKQKVVKKIRPYLEEAGKDCTEYREPFLGGGSVFLNSSGWDSMWINDIDPNIATFFKVVRDNPDSLKDLILRTKPTLEIWKEIRYSSPTNEIDVAFRTLFLNRTNYSGILNARPIGGFRQRSAYAIDCRWYPQTITKRIDVLSKKLKGVLITCQDFFFAINKPSLEKVFLFLDPPYYNKGKSLYEENLDLSDHERLRDLLADTKHAFLLTYDDCQGVRDLYASLPRLYYYRTRWKYSAATSSVSREYGKELFISNFPVQGVCEEEGPLLLEGSGM